MAAQNTSRDQPLAGEAAEVFIPLSDIGSNEASAGSWEAIDQIEDASEIAMEDLNDDDAAMTDLDDEPILDDSTNMITIRQDLQKALATLPKLTQAIKHSLTLVEAKQKTDAEMAVLRRLPCSPDNRLEMDLHKKVTELTEQNSKLRASLKQRKRENKGKGKAKAKETSTGSGPSGVRLDLDRITALAMALIEGDEPVEIAGALLDEIDRVTKGEADGPASVAAASPSGAGGSKGGDDLRDDLDDALERVKAVEEDIEAIKRSRLLAP